MDPDLPNWMHATLLHDLCGRDGARSPADPAHRLRHGAARRRCFARGARRGVRLDAPRLGRAPRARRHGRAAPRARRPRALRGRPALRDPTRVGRAARPHRDRARAAPRGWVTRVSRRILDVGLGAAVGGPGLSLHSDSVGLALAYLAHGRRACWRVACERCRARAVRTPRPGQAVRADGKALAAAHEHDHRPPLRAVIGRRPSQLRRSSTRTSAPTSSSPSVAPAAYQPKATLPAEGPAVTLR